MATTKYAKDHLRVRNKIDKIHEETGGSMCVPVAALSKELEMDPRTLKKHLEVMEIDGFGKFSDPEKKHIFCRVEK